MKMTLAALACVASSAFPLAALTQPSQQPAGSSCDPNSMKPQLEGGVYALYKIPDDKVFGPFEGGPRFVELPEQFSKEELPNVACHYLKYFRQAVEDGGLEYEIISVIGKPEGMFYSVVFGFARRPGQSI